VIEGGVEYICYGDDEFWVKEKLRGVSQIIRQRRCCMGYKETRVKDEKRKSGRWVRLAT